MAAKPKKPSLQARIKSGDRSAIKQALANPAWRRYVPSSSKLVSPKVKAQRQLNERLRQPITAGSTTTERDLARESRAAMDVKYGGLEQQQRQGLGEAQTFRRDIGNYYDDYQNRLQQHAQDVKGIGDTAVGQLKGLQEGVTGLAAADLTQLNQAATKDAEARGATSGDLAQMASNATATRQALVNSFAAQQAAHNTASSNYADALANVVAPGQKLQGVAQAIGGERKARDLISDTASRRGSDDLVYRQEKRSDEAKNILARTIATNKDQTAAAQLTETGRHNRAGETSANARIQAGREQAAARREEAAGRPNQYGYTDAQWRGMSTGQRQKAIKDFRANGGSSKKKQGPKWHTGSETGTALTQLRQMMPYMNKAKSGLKFDPPEGESPTKPGKKLDRNAAVQKVIEAMPDLKDPTLAEAVADKYWNPNGHLSPATVKKLIAAGYKPSQVSQTLGVQTGQQWRKAHPNYGKRPDTAGNPNVSGHSRHS